MSDDVTDAPDGDWRTFIAFETPKRVSEAYPWMVGEAWKDVLWCSSCGSNSTVRLGSDLWAIKHHHATQPLGHLRFYCQDHLPAREWSSGASGGDGAGSQGAVCPTCFTVLPMTGVCDTCG